MQWPKSIKHKHSFRLSNKTVFGTLLVFWMLYCVLLPKHMCLVSIKCCPWVHWKVVITVTATVKFGAPFSNKVDIRAWMCYYVQPCMWMYFRIPALHLMDLKLIFCQEAIPGGRGRFNFRMAHFLARCTSNRIYTTIWTIWTTETMTWTNNISGASFTDMG